MTNRDEVRTPTVHDTFSGPVHVLPEFVERIWGTDSLEPYYPSVPRTIGEAWLTGERCKLEGSALSLAELASRFPAEFGSPDGSGFPLLLKLLFPREKLSVQVHPDDALAQSLLDQPRGKTECWYVLAAEPGAELAVGFREPMGAEAVRAAVADGTLESRLRMLQVQAGDMVFVDAGTVHAIGGGMVVLETQQYSDVTYRLFDYGRPRELHVEEGLRVVRNSTRAGFVQPTAKDGFQELLACEFFSVDRFSMQMSASADLKRADSLQILVALADGVTVAASGTKAVPLPQFHAVVLPRANSVYELRSANAADVIRVSAR